MATRYVAYPHWLDHRILGTVAGDMRWPNGLVTLRNCSPDRGERGHAYEYDRTLAVRDGASQDAATVISEEAFPGGAIERYVYQLRR
jgi:hypothetical protein